MAAIHSAVRRSVILAGIWIAMFALAATAGTKSPNVLSNGGFEIQASTHAGPHGWAATQVPHTKEFVTFTWDDQIRHTGTRSISICIEKTHPDGQIDYNWNQAVPNFEPGKTYEVTGWIRTRNLNTTAFIVVQCWDKEFEKMLGFATTQKDFQVTGTSDWTLVKTTINIPIDAGRFMILAGIRAPDNRGGTVWFDNIQIAPKTNND